MRDTAGSSTHTMTGRPDQPTSGGRLLKKASQAALSNALFLPPLLLTSVLFSVLVRRRFGLFSGVYDIVTGLEAALDR